MKLYANTLSIIIIVLALTSCSLMSSAKVEPANRYVINNIPSVIPGKKHTDGVIMVSAPETIPMYNSQLMAYSDKPFRIAYFSTNQWAESPSQMLQPLIVQTLQNTHAFHTVVTAPFLGHYDYNLTTQILALRQDYTHKPPVLKLSVRAQLLKGIAGGDVIATRVITASERISPIGPYGGVLAANRATEQVLNQLAIFCLEHTGSSKINEKDPLLLRGAG